MKPLISIVVPTYNRSRDLRRALNSVLEQTYSNWEVLVVDNHSTDNTDDLIKDLGDSRIKLLKIHNNGVIAKSRNLGIRNATGEYVAFLDSDDWWMPQKLERSLEYLEQGADVVYHDLFLVTKPGRVWFWKIARTRVLKRPIFHDLIINGNALTNSSVLIRREILEQVGGIGENPDLIASEDYDLWLRVAKITERFSRIPLTLGYYWAGDGNFWSGGKGGVSLERMIKSLDYLETIFAEDFSGSRDSVFWVDYTRAKTYYRIGNYSLARKYIGLISRRGAPFSIRIKILFLLLVIALRNSETGAHA